MKINNESDFNFWVPIDFEKAKDEKTGEEQMIIQGIASTPDKDSDGEELLPMGFDLSRFLTSGFVNWNHKSKDTSGGAGAIIGEPIEAYVDKKGNLFIKALLYKGHRLAESVYNLAQTLVKNGSKRKLGWSIEGKAISRDPMNPKRITKALLTGVAVTHVPVNQNTFLDIVKGQQKDDFIEIQGEEMLKDSDIPDVLYEFEIEGRVFSINKSFEVNEIEKSQTEIQKEKVKKVMSEFKNGTLKDSHGNLVTSRQQAVAIAMSEAGIEKTMDVAAFTPVHDQSIDRDLKQLDFASKSCLKKAIELDIISATDLIEKAKRPPLTGGNWVTIEGNHVYIKGNKVVAGQPKVMGGGDKKEEYSKVDTKESDLNSSEKKAFEDIKNKNSWDSFDKLPEESRKKVGSVVKKYNESESKKPKQSDKSKIWGIEEKQERKNEESGYKIYSVNTKKGEMFAVQSEENKQKGVDRGFGDSLHMSYEEAVQEAKDQKKRVEKDKIYEKKQQEKIKQEEEQKKQQEAKRVETFGFTDDVSGIKKERILNALNKNVQWNGEFGTRKDLIKKYIEEKGYKVSKLKSGEEVLMSPNETFLDSKVLTKTGTDFAKYLESKNNKQSLSKLSPKATSILDNSQKAYDKAPMMKQKEFFEHVQKQIEADKNGKDKIGMGFDEDMVAAGKKFLENNKEDYKKILGILKERNVSKNKFTGYDVLNNPPKIGDKLSMKIKEGGVTHGTKGEVYEVSPSGKTFRLKDEFGNKDERWRNIEDYKKAQITRP